MACVVHYPIRKACRGLLYAALLRRRSINPRTKIKDHIEPIESRAPQPRLGKSSSKCKLALHAYQMHTDNSRTIHRLLVRWGARAQLMAAMDVDETVRFESRAHESEESTKRFALGERR
jgi:hypothetical protein